MKNNNGSSTAKISTVYTMNNKQIDPKKKSNYTLKSSAGAEFEVKGCTMKIGDNVKDVQITPQKITIIFKEK